MSLKEKSVYADYDTNILVAPYVTGRRNTSNPRNNKLYNQTTERNERQAKMIKGVILDRANKQNLKQLQVHGKGSKGGSNSYVNKKKEPILA